MRRIDRKRIEFNRALLVNGFRRLEALGVRQSIELMFECVARINDDNNFRYHNSNEVIRLRMRMILVMNFVDRMYHHSILPSTLCTSPSNTNDNSHHNVTLSGYRVPGTGSKKIYNKYYNTNSVVIIIQTP